MIEPFDWNVVVAGSWNCAILTPRWIQRRMFQSENTHIEVQVPIDAPGPTRVTLDRIAVHPSSSALAVAPLVCTLPELEKAATVAARAIASLPETPVSACGLNIRYRIKQSPGFVELCRSPIDDAVIGIGLVVQSRQLQRTLKYGEGPLSNGLVNLILSEDENGDGSIVFNYHRSANDPTAIQEWLRLTKEALGESVSSCFRQCLGMEVEIT